MRDSVFGFIAGCIFSALVISYMFFGLLVPKFANATSIEYTEKCDCGSRMECYESFVDRYGYKECKECGYYIEK